MMVQSKYTCYREMEQFSICISKTLKAWSMKEMSWKRWTESHWSTRSPRKSFHYWLVSSVLFSQIVYFNVFSLDLSVSISSHAIIFFLLFSVLLLKGSDFWHCFIFSLLSKNLIKRHNKASVHFPIPFGFYTISVAPNLQPYLFLLKM